MLLMNMNIAVAYICLRNLLDRPCLRAFYCGIEEETEAYYRVRPWRAGTLHDDGRRADNLARL
jgi:hypothetical protein